MSVDVVMMNRRQGSDPFILPFAPASSSSFGRSNSYNFNAFPTSPPQSPFARPPTPGGGPLSSHPTTPIDGLGGYSPPSSIRTTTTKQFPQPPRSFVPDTPPQSVTESPPPVISYPTHVPARKPLTPTSVNTPPLAPQRRDSTGPRKFLSFSSLRNSFSSSRGSAPGTPRPESSPHATFITTITHGVKRPVSPGSSIGGSGSIDPRPPLRKRKSSSWFRRKSGLFLFDGNGEQQAGENRPVITHPHMMEQEPDTRAHSRVPSLFSAEPPTLPEVGSLRGGSLTNGNLEKGLFENVGR